jgi:hypothetical protein
MWPCVLSILVDLSIEHKAIYIAMTASAAYQGYRAMTITWKQGLSQAARLTPSPKELENLKGQSQGPLKKADQPGPNQRPSQPQTRVWSCGRLASCCQYDSARLGDLQRLVRNPGTVTPRTAARGAHTGTKPVPGAPPGAQCQWAPPRGPAVQNLNPRSGRWAP